MSAFDDEFGLFGDEAGEEEERKSTLGARKIATGETIIDEIEPEDERPARRDRRGPGGPRPEGDQGGAPRWNRRREPVKRDPLPDSIAHPRAVELLTFLAKRLVGSPEAVVVELHPDPRGAVLELEVAPDDLGKVIGRGGRVAQALRTIVRAGAEGRVTIDIVDSGDDGDDDEDEAPVAAAAVAASAHAEPVASDDDEEEDEDAPADAVAEAPAKKKAAAKPRATKAAAKPAKTGKAAKPAAAEKPVAAEKPAAAAKKTAAAAKPKAAKPATKAKPKAKAANE